MTSSLPDNVGQRITGRANRRRPLSVQQQTGECMECSWLDPSFNVGCREGSKLCVGVAQLYCETCCPAWGQSEAQVADHLNREFLM